jgi:sec-independent protein translocase protein TatC
MPPLIERPDPDDFFAETRMSIGDHIEDLRLHLFRAIGGFLVGMVIGFFLGRPVMLFIAAPVESELMKFYEKRVTRKNDELKAENELLLKYNQPREISLELNSSDLRNALQPEKAPQEQQDSENASWVTIRARIHPTEVAIATDLANRMVSRPPTLTAFSVTETLLVWLKVSMACGVVLASPWIFWQLWSFIAAGLYPQERRQVYAYLPGSVFLFLAGVFFCEIIVLPAAVSYLLAFNDWVGIEPDLRLSEWLSFAVFVPLTFGAAFQTPLVMYVLYRVGIMEVETYKKNRKMAFFLLAVLACLLAATPDAVGMLSLSIPLWGLYEVGILLCRWFPRPKSEFDEEDADLAYTGE